MAETKFYRALRDRYQGFSENEKLLMEKGELAAQLE